MEKQTQLGILHGAFDVAVQKGAFNLAECEAIIDALKAFSYDIEQENNKEDEKRK